MQRSRTEGITTEWGVNRIQIHLISGRKNRTMRKKKKHRRIIHDHRSLPTMAQTEGRIIHDHRSLPTMAQTDGRIIHDHRSLPTMDQTDHQIRLSLRPLPVQIGVPLPISLSIFELLQFYNKLVVLRGAMHDHNHLLLLQPLCPHQYRVHQLLVWDYLR